MVARLDASHELRRLRLADQPGAQRGSEAFLDVPGADTHEHLLLGAGIVRAQLLELLGGEVAAGLET